MDYEPPYIKLAKLVMTVLKETMALVGHTYSH